MKSFIHPRGEDASDTHEDPKLNFPDVGYPGFVELGNGLFAMSYYEGRKGLPADIHLVKLAL